MNSFTKIEDVADFPGEWARCGGCGEVVLNDQTMDHACPPTDEEKQKAQEQEDVLALFAVIQDEALPIGERCAAVHTLHRVQEILWQNGLRRVLARFTPAIVYQLVMDERHEALRRVREMRQEQFDLNDARRSAGVSFVERKKLMDHRKVAWCDEQELQLNRSFTVRPLAEWFDEVDYWAAKEMGMRWIIRMKMDQIINT